MNIQTGDNKFGVAQWIVDSTVGLGTHTTIAGALTASSSGEDIFIRPGTYTEDLILKEGVNLVAFKGDVITSPVTIVGNSTATFAGTCSINDIRLTTNSAAFLTVSGTLDTKVYLQGCFLDILDNDGIVFSSSSADSEIRCDNCKGDIGTTGIKIFDKTSPGNLIFNYCIIDNRGASVTDSTITDGLVNINGSAFKSSITTSSTAGINMQAGNISVGALNITGITVGGSGKSAINKSFLTTGTAPAISVGSTLTIRECVLLSTNINIVVGAGITTYTTITQGTSAGNIGSTGPNNAGPVYTGGISFDGGINTLHEYEEGIWTPGLAFGGSTTGMTYSTQTGSYTRIGRVVYIIFKIVLSAKGSSLGGAVITGLPFFSGVQNSSIAINDYGLLTYSASRDAIRAESQGGSTEMALGFSGNAVSIVQLSESNFIDTTSIQGSGFYFNGLHKK